MKNTLFIPEQKTLHFYLPPHTVTWKQDFSHLRKGLLKNDLETFLVLYSLAETDPKKAKKEAEIFQNNYPDHPEVLNLLSYLNIRRKRIRQAERLIDENFQKIQTIFLPELITLICV